MSDTADSLDMQTIDELRGILEAEADELFAEYLRDVPTQLHQLHQAAEQGDLEGLVQAAHSLKGSSGNLGMRAMYECCRQLESLGREGKLPQIPPQLEQLNDEFGRTREALEQLLGAAS